MKELDEKDRRHPMSNNELSEVSLGDGVSEINEPVPHPPRDSYGNGRSTSVEDHVAVTIKNDVVNDHEISPETTLGTSATSGSDSYVDDNTIIHVEEGTPCNGDVVDVSSENSHPLLPSDTTNIFDGVDNGMVHAQQHSQDDEQGDDDDDDDVENASPRVLSSSHSSTDNRNEVDDIRAAKDCCSLFLIVVQFTCALLYISLCDERNLFIDDKWFVTLSTILASLAISLLGALLRRQFFDSGETVSFVLTFGFVLDALCFFMIRSTHTFVILLKFISVICSVAIIVKLKQLLGNRYKRWQQPLPRPSKLTEDDHGLMVLGDCYKEKAKFIVNQFISKEPNIITNTILRLANGSGSFRGRLFRSLYNDMPEFLLYYVILVPLCFIYLFVLFRSSIVWRSVLSIGRLCYLYMILDKSKLSRYSSEILALLITAQMAISFLLFFINSIFERLHIIINGCLIVFAFSINAICTIYVENKNNDRSSPFDFFMGSYKDKRPSPDKIEDFLNTMLPEASETATARNYNGHSDNSEAEPSCCVVQDGISVDWFLDVFMKQREIEIFVQNGCQMWFLREHGIKRMLRTREVSSGPVIDHLEKFDITDGWKGGDPLRTKATRFVSFTGSYTIKHFADLLENSDLRGEYVWIDVFCVDQFAWAKSKDEKFRKKFMEDIRDLVGTIGHTVLMLDRWYDIMGTLGQVWVIWEIFATADADAKFTILFNNDEFERFWRVAIQTYNTEKIVATMATIDAAKAKAYDINDEHKIKERIQDIGISKVNAIVCNQMLSWIVDKVTTIRPVNSSNNEHDDMKAQMVMAELHRLQGEFDKAKHLLNDVRKNTRQINDLYLDATWQLGNILFEEKLDAEAELIWGEIVVLTGGNNLDALHNLALTWMEVYHPKTEKFLRRILTIQRQRFGINAIDTLITVHNLTCLLLRKGKFNEAMELTEVALKGYQKQLGDKHRCTLNSFVSMGELLSLKGEYEKADYYFQKGLSGYEEQFGPSHPQTRNNRRVVDCWHFRAELVALIKSGQFKLRTRNRNHNTETKHKN